MRGLFSDLTGKSFGRLSVLGAVKVEGKSGIFWDCICSCGGKPSKPINSHSLISGKTISCGCYKIERIKQANSTHKQTKTPTYYSWKLMWQRCTNPSHKSYEAYKNFVPCHRWRSYENFLIDMGTRPSGHTLDRIDNTKGYEPSNCRWADAYTQQGNTKRNIYVQVDGQVLCLKAACRLKGVSYQMAKARVRSGWSPLDAITKPKMKNVTQ